MKINAFNTLITHIATLLGRCMFPRGSQFSGSLPKETSTHLVTCGRKRECLTSYPTRLKHEAGTSPLSSFRGKALRCKISSSFLYSRFYLRGILEALLGFRRKALKCEEGSKLPLWQILARAILEAFSHFRGMLYIERKPLIFLSIDSTKNSFGVRTKHEASTLTHKNTFSTSLINKNKQEALCKHDTSPSSQHLQSSHSSKDKVNEAIGEVRCLTSVWTSLILRVMGKIFSPLLRAMGKIFLPTTKRCGLEDSPHNSYSWVKFFYPLLLAMGKKFYPTTKSLTKSHGVFTLTPTLRVNLRVMGKKFYPTTLIHTLSHGVKKICRCESMRAVFGKWFSKFASKSFVMGILGSPSLTSENFLPRVRMRMRMRMRLNMRPESKVKIHVHHSVSNSGDEYSGDGYSGIRHHHQSMNSQTLLEIQKCMS